ncbi:hypothetical protein H9Q69_009713 [Fusarium xylarioides]|nr:hypothetical protein H9Q69_009713 [Fusarium xylarioides]
MSNLTPDIKAATWFDEDAVYREKHPLDPDDGPETLDLYDTETSRPEGALKTFNYGDETQAFIVNKEKTEYSITAERLLWIDSPRQGTANGNERPDDLTLVVINLSFQAKREHRRIDNVIAELRFQSERKGDKDPEVIAWGPFYDIHKWNSSDAKRTLVDKTNLRAAVGWAGPEVSLQKDRENGTEWTEFNYEKGESIELRSLRKKMRHGVRWMVTQNRRLNLGITPRLRIGVLLRRHYPNEPYFVTLNVEAHATSMGSRWSEGLSRVGFKGGDQLIWRTVPHTTTDGGCHEDGRQIAMSIDAKRLGDLVDHHKLNNLNQAWLYPQNQIEDEDKHETSPMVSEGKAAVSTTEVASDPGQARNQQPPVLGPTVVTATADDDIRANSMPQTRSTTAEHSSAPVPAVLASAPPGIEFGWNGRLISLEARAAQAEARIAAQDQIILKLQQSILGMGQLRPA